MQFIILYPFPACELVTAGKGIEPLTHSVRVPPGQQSAAFKPPFPRLYRPGAVGGLYGPVYPGQSMPANIVKGFGAFGAGHCVRYE